MGYETRFKLTALTIGDKVANAQHDYLKVLAEIDPQEFSPEANSFKEEFKEPRKWYNYKNDMKELSLAFPTTYFLLYGVGEEPGDVWKAYFYNGTIQIVKALLIFENEPMIAEIRNYEQFHPFDLCPINSFPIAGNNDA